MNEDFNGTKLMSIQHNTIKYKHNTIQFIMQQRNQCFYEQQKLISHFTYRMLHLKSCFLMKKLLQNVCA